MNIFEPRFEVASPDFLLFEHPLVKSYFEGCLFYCELATFG